VVGADARWGRRSARSSVRRRPGRYVTGGSDRRYSVTFGLTEAIFSIGSTSAIQRILGSRFFDTQTRSRLRPYSNGAAIDASIWWRPSTSDRRVIRYWKFPGTVCRVTTSHPSTRDCAVLVILKERLRMPSGSRIISFVIDSHHKASVSLPAVPRVRWRLPPTHSCWNKSPCIVYRISLVSLAERLNVSPSSPERLSHDPYCSVHPLHATGRWSTVSIPT